jgi:hypothetical protein
MLHEDIRAEIHEKIGAAKNTEDVRPQRKLIALTAGELLAMEIPKREMLLAPACRRKGL